METVNEIRGATWIAYLLDKGGYKSLAEMHEALDLVGSVQSWGQYKAGKASPQESTVKLADRAVSGSAELWQYGPGGLPLWAVLEGDLAVCGQFVEGVLGDYLNPKIWMLLARKPLSRMTEADRLKAFLEIVLPAPIWYPKDIESAEMVNPMLDSPTTNSLKGWLSLDDVFQASENVLAVAYLKDRLLTKEKNVIKSFVYDMVAKITGKATFTNKPDNNLTNPTYVLATIALLQQCLESRDKTLMNAPEFIKLGIHQAVIDCFGVPVGEFVKGL